MADERELLSLMKGSGTSPFRTCQWPFGHPGESDFHFCGKMTYGTFSYCRDHVEAAYRVPESRNSSPVNSGRRAA